MRLTFVPAGFVVVCLLAAPVSLGAQDGDGEGGGSSSTATVAERMSGRPNVFLDCQGPNCNDQYYRTEISWVNWVRDPADSHVHVIVTSQGTGAGGREYQLDFIGRERWEEYQDQVVYQSLPTDTQRESLDGLTQTLGVGIARFAGSAGFRGIVRLEGGEPAGPDPAAGVVAPQLVDDPWNLWVFRFGAGGNLEGEDTQSDVRFNGFLNASRVTPNWKVSYGGFVSHERIERELSTGPSINTQTDWNVNALLVSSVASNWSGGINFRASRMPRFNQDLSIELRPAAEFSFFPYQEATRRALTAFYQIGPTYRNYQTETLDGFMEETRVEQSLELEFSQRQPWGDASVSASGSHFLHDFSRNRFALNGDLSLRIFRGFSVNTNAQVEWLNNQIYISNEGETDEEILLDLRQQATGFSYGVDLGFSYQFGSIFNNVVNNRFNGGRRGFGGFGGGRGGNNR